MAKHTGQPVETIEKDLERDNFMSAEAAVKYGLIDTVLERRSEMKPMPKATRPEITTARGRPQITL